MQTNSREQVGQFAMQITAVSRSRYNLHRKARHRIQTDLAAPGQHLNQKLTAWWTLDFPAFRAEVTKALKQDIALKERDDWEAWLIENRTEHERLTAEIIRLETELNATSTPSSIFPPPISS
jgi:hypothetical protein